MSDDPKQGPARKPPPGAMTGNAALSQPGAEVDISSPWTRSPGRVRFRDLLRRSIDRGNYSFAVLYADLDRFTIVNDSLGRAAGDRLLLDVARRLRGCLRSQDVLTRLREDEYLIFLGDVQGSGKALEVAERIRAALREPFQVSGQGVFVTASAGIAIGPGGYSRPEEIVRDAESAMHRAKSKGPGSYLIFDSQIQEGARKLLKLETDLRGAIELEQLVLQYEPIVHLESGRVAGFEALLRWQHPERGLVYPGEFLPLAEETGLIIPITRWVLRRAFGQLQQWQSRFADFASLWLSVNLSPQYIEKCDFGQEVSDAVAQSGVEASNLVMEITENQLLENAEPILKGFAALQELGIKLWIDDFGAGYSSLAYLVKFPIHSLKIDRSFIMKLRQDDKNAAIARAIIALGKTLDVSVIAEGVETAEQLEFLRTAECPYAQGHYFSGSINSDTIDSLFTAKQ